MHNEKIAKLALILSLIGVVAFANLGTDVSITGDLNLNNYNITNCLNCGYKIKNMTDNTSRVLNTTIQNNLSVPIDVDVSMICISSSIYVYFGTNATNGVERIFTDSTVSGRNLVSFKVLPYYYYRVRCGVPGTASVLHWIEWS